MWSLLSPFVMPVYGTIIGIIVGALLTRFRGMSSSVRAIRIGVAVLLRARLEHFHEKYKDGDTIPKEEFQEMNDTWEAYHSLGGNSTGDKIHEELKGKTLV